MGWKTINGRRYYYKSERDGGRVKSTYFGAGEAGTLMAQMVAFDRESPHGSSGGALATMSPSRSMASRCYSKPESGRLIPSIRTRMSGVSPSVYSPETPGSIAHENAPTAVRWSRGVSLHRGTAGPMLPHGNTPP
jgi:hypothetical protein